MNTYEVRAIDNRYAVVRGDDIVAQFSDICLAEWLRTLLTGEAA